MFATCSFPEFKPDEMPGVPVRTSIGFPRYRLSYGLVHTMPELFPDRAMLRKETLAEYAPLYLAKIRAVGVDGVRAAAARVRAAAKVGEDVPLVLLCFDQLWKRIPNNFCHRTLFAAWWTQETGEEVPEYGRVLAAEIRAQESTPLNPQLW